MTYLDEFMAVFKKKSALTVGPSRPDSLSAGVSYHHTILWF
jgi:hypothetical protein